MSEYHKIDTVFKRDPETKHKTLLVGDYSQEAFAFLADNEWVWTEKVDGTNIRVMVGDGKIAFGGRTDAAQIPAFLIERLQERFLPQRDALLDAFPSGAILYGEGYGARIQKGGGNYRQDQDFVLFDVRVGEWWLQRDNVTDIANKFGLDVVPIIGSGTLAAMVKATQDGFDSMWGAFKAEGIVARPYCELRTRNGHRVITKIKHKDFVQVAQRAARAAGVVPNPPHSPLSVPKE